MTIEDTTGTIITCKGMFKPFFDALEVCKTSEPVMALVRSGEITVFEGAKMIRESRIKTVVSDETGMFAPGTVKLELEELFENNKKED